MPWEINPRAHPEYGTAVGVAPLMWPKGYTGRRVGSEVEVRSPSGMVVLITGRKYFLYEPYLGGVGGNSGTPLYQIATADCVAPYSPPHPARATPGA